MASKQVVIMGTMVYDDSTGAPTPNPPGIWGGGNQPFPTPPIVLPTPPGQPPGPWVPTFPQPPIEMPGEPPIIPGLKPEHPIVLPPFTPSHPIIIPPETPEEPPIISIWPPLPNNDLPEPEPPPIGGCHRLVYSVRYGWALVQLAKKDK